MYLIHDNILFSGRRNPLRMLSNAIDFRSRRKQRPKSADFEIVDEVDGERTSRERREKQLIEPPRSASVTDLLESVTLSKKDRVLEGRNSAPDIIPNNAGLKHPPELGKDQQRMLAAAVGPRHRARGGTSTLVTKQKLSTRFQPQRKAAHRTTGPAAGLAAAVVSHSNSVRRAKTFNHGGSIVSSSSLTSSTKQKAGHHHHQPGYTTLPKQGKQSSSTRSLVSSSSSNEGSQSTDSGQGTPSSTTDTCSTGSRKSSNSSYTSTNSADNSAAAVQISQSALDEIAAFEKFIEDYFENVDNNNVGGGNSSESGPSPSHTITAKMKGTTPHKKVSSTSTLSEILELSI